MIELFTSVNNLIASVISLLAVLIATRSSK
jgi:hypothetical protein|nr:MAG TPA: hypothetical protein [Caudoviricetes sp.]